MDTSCEILRLAEVRRRTGLSNTSIYALVTAGKFPRQVKLGVRMSGWVRDEIDAWVRERIAERDAR